MDEKLIDIREELERKANVSVTATKDDLTRLRLAFIEEQGKTGSNKTELTMSPLLEEVFTVLRKKADASLLEDEVGAVRRELQKLGNVIEGRTERKISAAVSAGERGVAALATRMDDLQSAVGKVEAMASLEVKEAIAQQATEIVKLSNRVDAVKVGGNWLKTSNLGSHRASVLCQFTFLFLSRRCLQLLSYRIIVLSKCSILLFFFL